MAHGDIAAATGLPVVPPTADIRLGYDEINLTRDEVATHMTTGTHTWAKVLGKPATYPATAHNHDDRYYTEAEALALLAGKATKSTKGGLAVGSISGQQIGLRFENNVVVQVNAGAEFELAARAEVIGRINAIEARLDAHGI